MTPLYPHMTYLAAPEIGALIAPSLAALILAAVMTDYALWVAGAVRRIRAFHVDRGGAE